MVEVLQAPHLAAIFRALVRCILNSGQTSRAQLHQQIIASPAKPIAAEIMSTAEQIRNEGRVEGRAETLRQVLEYRLGVLPKPLVEIIHQLDEDDLSALTPEAVRLESIEALRSWLALR